MRETPWRSSRRLINPWRRVGSRTSTGGMSRLPTLFAVFALLGCARQDGNSNDAGSVQAAKLEKEGRWAEAASLLRAEVLRLGPETWSEPVRRAFADYLMADRLEDAERFAGECLERSPGSHEVLY